MSQDDLSAGRRKRLKQLYQQLHDELCRLLYDLDPEVVGVKVDNPHWDEYSLEVNSILPRLTRAGSLDEAKDIIREEFHRWFGKASLIDESLDAVAKEIWETFNRIWQNSALDE